MRLRLSLSTLHLFFIIGFIVLAIVAAAVFPIGDIYTAGDKHSVIINLVVLLFTAVIIERLNAYKILIEGRRADEQRILGFNEVLEIYLVRYLQFADAMTRPMDSYVVGKNYQRELANIEFPDLENMYNISLVKFVPMHKKCYQLYFEAAIELGDFISSNLAYVYSSHYEGVTKALLTLAGHNNRLDKQAMYEGFKERERGVVGSVSTISSDREFFQNLRSGKIKQTVDFIESNSHSLSDYARTYNLMKRDFEIIQAYRELIALVKQKHEQLPRA